MENLVPQEVMALSPVTATRTGETVIAVSVNYIVAARAMEFRIENRGPELPLKHDLEKLRIDAGVKRFRW